MNNGNQHNEVKGPNEMLREVHLAVCGNEQLGVPGLVADVRELKDWRRRLDLRVATISGGTIVVIALLKWAAEKLT